MTVKWALHSETTIMATFFFGYIASFLTNMQAYWQNNNFYYSRIVPRMISKVSPSISKVKVVYALQFLLSLRSNKSFVAFCSFMKILLSSAQKYEICLFSQEQNSFLVLWKVPFDLRNKRWIFLFWFLIFIFKMAAIWTHASQNAMLLWVVVVWLSIV